MQCGLSGGKKKLTIILMQQCSMQVTKGTWRMPEQCVPGSSFLLSRHKSLGMRLLQNMPQSCKSVPTPAFDPVSCIGSKFTAQTPCISDVRSYFSLQMPSYNMCAQVSQKTTHGRNTLQVWVDVLSSHGSEQIPEIGKYSCCKFHVINFCVKKILQKPSGNEKFLTPKFPERVHGSIVLRSLRLRAAWKSTKELAATVATMNIKY